jgi:hypothetical protein
VDPPAGINEEDIGSRQDKFDADQEKRTADMKAFNDGGKGG